MTNEMVGEAVINVSGTCERCGFEYLREMTADELPGVKGP